MYMLYDILVLNDDFTYSIIQVIAISEIDAWHICEVKGYYVKDVVKSLE